MEIHFVKGPAAADVRPSSMKLSLFDQTTLPIYNRFVYFWPPDRASALQDTAALHKSLAQLLQQYPHLSGRLVRHPDASLEILLDPETDAIPLSTVTAPPHITFAGLAACNFDPRQFPETEALSFFPCTAFAARTQLGLQGARAVPLIAVQVTHLGDGGAAVALCVNHQVCDGRATFALAAAWGALHRGATRAVPEPCHNRAALSDVAARSAGSASQEFATYTLMRPSCGAPGSGGKATSDPSGGGGADSQRGIDDYEARIPDYEARNLVFSEEELRRMKAAAASPASLSTDVRWISTMDALAAHVWRAVMRARSVAGAVSPPGSEVVEYWFAVDVRRRLEPPLPLEFSGNAVIPTSVPLPLADMLDPSPAALIAAAAAIRRVVDGCDAAWSAAALGWLAAQEDKTKIVQRGLVPSPAFYLITDWRFDDVYAIDFGEGPPARFRTAPLGGIDISCVLPQPPGVGGVELYMGCGKAVWDVLDLDVHFCRGI